MEVGEEGPDREPLPNLPEIAPAHDQSELSFGAMKTAFEERFIVRQEGERDYGIDGSIELRLHHAGSGRRFATNKRAYFQLKSTASPRFSRDGMPLYDIELKNIAYLSQSLPAFYVLFLATSGELWFCWWKDAAPRITNAQHQAAKTVRVRFTRKIDSALLEEVAAEIITHHNQVQSLRDGPYFVRHFEGVDLPEPIFPINPFVGRHAEFVALSDRFRPGTIVPIVGSPESGKTQLIGHYLLSKERVKSLSQKMGRDLGLIVVDPSVRISSHRLLRALSFALGLGKLDSLPDADLDESPGASVSAELLGQGLPFRLQRLIPLIVVDNWQECLTSDSETQDLNDLLASSSLRIGVAIILSRINFSPTPRGRMTVEPALSLGPMIDREAIDLIAKLTGDRGLAEVVVRRCHGLEELLLPGIISRAARAFSREIVREDSKPPEDSFLDLLVETANGSIVELLRSAKVNLELRRDGKLTPFGNLLVVSIIAELELDRALLSSEDLRAFAKIPNHPSWIIRTEHSYRLGTSLKLGLRYEVKKNFYASPEESASIVSGAKRFLEKVGGNLGEANQSKFADAVEEALGWVRRELPRDLAATHDLEVALLRHLVPFVIDDAVLPISAAEWSELSNGARLDQDPPEPMTVLPQLVLSAREGTNAEEFLHQTGWAVDELIGFPDFPYYFLRTLDLAIFLGSSRFRLDSAALEIRQRVAAHLMAWAEQRPQNRGLLKWSASWALNFGSLAVKSAKIKQAKGAVGLAEELIGKIGPPESRHAAIDWLWLNSRLSTLQARIEVGSLERMSKLRQALGYASGLVRLSGGHIRWVRFYLRAARKVLEDLRTDQERMEITTEIFAYLERELGPIQDWSLNVRSQVAALVRDQGSLNGEPESRLNSARLAVTFLSVEEVLEACEQGDARPILVLSRCVAFQASCLERDGRWDEAIKSYKKALSLCQRVLEQVSSVDAWELNLHLLDEVHTLAPRDWGDSETISGPEATLPPALRSNISAFRKWLKTPRFMGGAEGRLLLWCQEREWKAEGSLERWIKKTKVSEEVWMKMPALRKRVLLKEAADVRKRTLAIIEKRTVPFYNLFVARARNEAQYQRLLAIYGDHKVDAAPVAAHFRAAEKELPFAAQMMAEEAQFYGYIWDYPNAIDCYRRAILATMSGSRRRELIIQLVRNLVAAACCGQSITSPSGTSISQADLLSEAKYYIAEVAGFRGVASDVAVLHDRLMIECGEDLDWKKFDETFDLVVGDVSRYVETIIKNGAGLRGEGQDRLPSGVAELVRADYTNARVLREMGSLYLRRVEKGKSPDPVLDCRKAYAVFDACRVLERAWLGAETPTSCFRRGRAILVAASLSMSCNPFTIQGVEASDLLHVAEKAAQKAVAQSVGLFHLEARRTVSEIAKLRNKLRQPQE